MPSSTSLSPEYQLSEHSNSNSAVNSANGTNDSSSSLLPISEYNSTRHVLLIGPGSPCGPFLSDSTWGSSPLPPDIIKFLREPYTRWEWKSGHLRIILVKCHNSRDVFECINRIDGLVTTGTGVSEVLSPMTNVQPDLPAWKAMRCFPCEPRNTFDWSDASVKYSSFGIENREEDPNDGAITVHPIASPDIDIDKSKWTEDMKEQIRQEFCKFGKIEYVDVFVPELNTGQYSIYAQPRAADATDPWAVVRFFHIDHAKAAVNGYKSEAHFESSELLSVGMKSNSSKFSYPLTKVALAQYSTRCQKSIETQRELINSSIYDARNQPSLIAFLTPTQYYSSPAYASHSSSSSGFTEFSSLNPEEVTQRLHSMFHMFRMLVDSSQQSMMHAKSPMAASYIEQQLLYQAAAQSGILQLARACTSPAATAQSISYDLNGLNIDTHQPDPRPMPRAYDITPSRNSRNSRQIDIEAVRHGLDTRTSLMLRNIPNKYTLPQILSEIRQCGCGDLHTDVHLPVDSFKNTNLGYAFLTMKNPEAVVDFALKFQHRKWSRFSSSKKVAEVTYADRQPDRQEANH